MDRRMMLMGGLGLIGTAASGCVVRVREPVVVRNNPPPPPPRSQPVVVYYQRYQNEGWRKLGERMVNAGVDRDVIPVGRVDGTFKEILIHVENSAIEMYDMAVVFGDGQVWHPNVRHRFGANSLSKIIDLPGGRRVINRVEFLYRDLPGGGRATVELWGR